jgi:hypothetical protein
VSGGSVLVIRTKEENLSIRTQVLLIRSCLATLGALTSDLSAFFHPYISHVLQTVLPLMAMTTTTTSSSSSSFPDSIQLYHDTKAYLSTLIKSIPKRLCIPALVQVTPILFSMQEEGHKVAYHYSLFLKDLWMTLERNDVMNYLISLQTISQYGLEYRERYEGYTLPSLSSLSSSSMSTSSVNVDGAICESIIEICLKYTEKELREYLLRLFHWTEETIDDNDITTTPSAAAAGVGVGVEGRNEWLKYCRCKIFFQFICELEKKLQSIFIPLMGIVWVYGSEQVMKYVKFITTAGTGGGAAAGVRGGGKTNDDLDSHQNKGSKKRKRKDQEEHRENSTVMTSTSQSLIQSELHETSLWILEAVRLCCVHDNIHFIDQVDIPSLPLQTRPSFYLPVPPVMQIQYETMMPSISSLLSLPSSHFPSDEVYKDYALNKVLPCIIQLVISVGKDILWKPLNHKILQMTRNQNKVTRLVALKSLQKLFIEVSFPSLPCLLLTLFSCV